MAGENAWLHHIVLRVLFSINVHTTMTRTWKTDVSSKKIKNHTWTSSIVIAYGKWQITARTAPRVTNHDDACRMQIYCRARSSRLRSRKEGSKDNIMIICKSDMFLYLIMLNLLKETIRTARDTTVNDYLCFKGVNGAKFGPIFHTQFVVGLCVDGSANYSSQVLHVAYLPISGSYFSPMLIRKRHLWI